MLSAEDRDLVARHCPHTEPFRPERVERLRDEREPWVLKRSFGRMGGLRRAGLAGHRTRVGRRAGGGGAGAERVLHPGAVPGASRRVLWRTPLPRVPRQRPLRGLRQSRRRSTPSSPTRPSMWRRWSVGAVPLRPPVRPGRRRCTRRGMGWVRTHPGSGSATVSAWASGLVARRSSTTAAISTTPSCPVPACSRATGSNGSCTSFPRRPTIRWPTWSPPSRICCRRGSRSSVSRWA